MNEEAADIHTLSGAYTLDALGDAEKAAFERHLESCEACRDEIHSFRDAVTAMADDATTPPPDRLRASVLSAIAQVRPLAPEVGTDVPSNVAQLAPRHARRATTWLAVAAAVLGIAMAGAVWRVTSLQGQVSELASASAELRSVLTAPDATVSGATASTGGRATVVVSQSKGEAALVTSDLAPVPAGKTYQVWYVGTDKISPAGFVLDAGSTSTLLAGDPGKAVAVGITVEPAGGSPQPTSTPFLAIDLPAGA
jgi:anti-sigma-K factor RskA